MHENWVSNPTKIYSSFLVLNEWLSGPHPHPRACRDLGTGNLKVFAGQGTLRGWWPSVPHQMTQQIQQMTRDFFWFIWFYEFDEFLWHLVMDLMAKQGQHKKLAAEISWDGSPALGWWWWSAHLQVWHPPGSARSWSQLPWNPEMAGCCESDRLGTDQNHIKGQVGNSTACFIKKVFNSRLVWNIFATLMFLRQQKCPPQSAPPITFFVDRSPAMCRNDTTWAWSLPMVFWVPWRNFWGASSRW